MSTELVPTPHQLMDAADEKQIAAAMLDQTELLQVYVYQYKTRDGRTVTSLSNEGIKEAVRHRRNVKIEKLEVARDGDKFVGIAIVHDIDNNVDFAGIAEADVNDRFGRTKAGSKALRNAYRGTIPQHVYSSLIAKRLETGEGVQVMYEDDADQPLTPKVDGKKTLKDYRAPPKKVEATPIMPPDAYKNAPEGTTPVIGSQVTQSDGSILTRIDYEPNQPPTPTKIVPPLQVMINKEKEQQAKKADELRKDNKVSNTSFTHTIPDSTGKLVPVTEEEYITYCQMNQTGPASDNIIWTATSGGNYEKAYEKQNKGNPEYEYLKDSLMEAKEKGQKSLTVDGLTYFIDTFTGDGILRNIPKKEAKS